MTQGPPGDAVSKKPTTLADLGPRLASGLVMIALALAALLAGGPVFVIFWLAAGLAVFWEWQRMIGGQRLALRLSVGAFALVAIAVLAGNAQSDAALLTVLVGAIILAAVAEPGRRIWAAGGMLYAGALVLSVVVLRMSILGGFEAILWLFAIVWGTDVMAYFGGRLIGGPKLWRRVSPSKTWAGFLVGITSGALLGLAVLSFYAVQIYPVPLLLLGLLVGALAQGGDLFESSLKRHFDVKDSSHLIPGHGGFMDRLDGFIAASAFAAAFGAMKAGAAAAAHGLFIW